MNMYVRRPHKSLVEITRSLRDVLGFVCAGIYDPGFIAANQEARADNVIKGSKQQQVEAVREHIRAFKQDNGLDKVVVLWTANTERYAQVRIRAAYYCPLLSFEVQGLSVGISKAWCVPADNYTMS